MIVIMFNSISTLFEVGVSISLPPQEPVFRTGDQVQFVYLVKAGEVDLIRYTSDGKPLILKRTVKGNILAEASVYSRSYHCDGISRTKSCVVRIRVSDFKKTLTRNPQIMEAWTANLARELQKSRMQSEIRSLKTVAERLQVWLDDDNSLPEKGFIQDLAHILGVSREALYRELARRRY